MKYQTYNDVVQALENPNITIAINDITDSAYIHQSDQYSCLRAAIQARRNDKTLITGIMKKLQTLDYSKGEKLKDHRLFLMYRGNVDEMRSYLEKSQTALEDWLPDISLLAGNLQIVKELIDTQKLDVSYTDPDTDDNLLHIAAEKKQWEILNYLLSLNKIDPSARNDEGNSLVDLLILYGTPDILDTLLKKYPLDITSVPENCLSPLQYAVQEGKLDFVNYFI